MIAAVSERASDLAQLCVRYNVERLGLFGSAAFGSRGKGASDQDFLVEFQPLLFLGLILLACGSVRP